MQIKCTINQKMQIANVLSEQDSLSLCIVKILSRAA